MTAPIIRMNNAQIKALSEIEVHWNLTGKLKIPHWFDEVQLRQAMELESFRLGFKNRGIPLPPVGIKPGAEIETIGSLTVEQSAAIMTVLNFSDKRTKQRKLSDLGITTAKWNGWMKQKEFKKAVLELTVVNFQDELPTAHESLIKAMERGSTEAIKFYMEVTGRYDPSASGLTMGAVQSMIGQLIEVMQMHVKDPHTLAMIQRDFKLALDGQKPIGPPMEITHGI